MHVRLLTQQRMVTSLIPLADTACGTMSCYKDRKDSSCLLNANKEYYYCRQRLAAGVALQMMRADVEPYYNYTFLIVE